LVPDPPLAPDEMLLMEKSFPTGRNDACDELGLGLFARKGIPEFALGLFGGGILDCC
jgi:hypothetical protein